MKNRRDDGIVYSTELGKMCPSCSKAVSDCACRHTDTSPEGDGIVRISRENKGRKGKGVTLIRGIPLPPQKLNPFAKRLKQACGSGGTVKAGVIEIQGDHRDQLIEILKKEGWVVKRAGG
ncbi:MAG: translation initiation factor Sui1 [Nitrospirota bacterium]|nr:translation initiation factor Sui1 [Nitrospirota bacterium]